MKTDKTKISKTKNRLEQPVMLHIDRIENENEAESVKTFYFKHKLNAKPGQFVMLWLPRINQKPFSISFQDKKTFALTIASVGECTKKLFELKKADIIGIQGPYGNFFSAASVDNAILVGGGYGSAPLAFLAESLAEQNKNVTLIIGAKTEKEMIYKKRFENKTENKIKLIQCTDDGSFGKKGFATQALEEEMANSKANNNTINFVYACGPEIMMRKILEICDANKIPCQFSLEKKMKCGIGLCGSCCAKPSGIRLCKEGPVLNREQAREIFMYNQNITKNTTKK